MIPSSLETFAPLLLALAGCFAFAALGCAAEPTSCNTTDGCVCDEKVADCDLACSGKGCEFTCPSGKTCSFACPEGGCKATGDSKSSFDLACSGVGCSVVCDELVYTAGPSTEEISCDTGCACQ